VSNNAFYVKNSLSCLITLAILFFCFPVFSQTIEGQIKNINNEPIVGAHISSQPSNRITNSDEEGKFQLIMPFNDSSVRLKITHILHKTKFISLDKINNNAFINIVLEDTIVSLKEVNVIQRSILQRLSDRTKAAIIVDEKFLDRNNTGTLANSLDKLPGINSINTGVNIAKPVIRGMSGNRIIVNNHGIKQEGQQWGAEHGLEIDPFNVNKVEIIKGPASLLYGSDGLGGVIRVLPNEIPANNDHHVVLNSSYQSNNHAFSNSLNYVGRSNKWFYDSRVTYQDYGDYSIPTNEYTYAGFVLPIEDQRLKNTAGKELHFKGRIGYTVKDFKTSLQFTSFNQHVGIFSGAIGLPRAYNLRHNGLNRNIDYPRQETRHNMLISNSSYRRGPHRLELDLGFQQNLRKELSFPGAHAVSPEFAGSNLALGLKLSTYTANLRYEYNRSPKHQILWGGQFQYMLNGRSGFEFLLPEYTSLQTGAYHFQLYDFNEKWTITAGIRYDYGQHDIEQHLQPVFDRATLEPTGELSERTPSFNRTFSNFSGGSGLIYRINKAHHLKLNLGNSFRFPTPIELASNGVHHGNFRHEVGNNNLKTENGYQLDITYLFESKSSFLEISTFQAFYEDFIYLAPSGNFSSLASGGTVWEYRQNDALFNGFELMLKQQISENFTSGLTIDFIQNLNLDSELPLPLSPATSVLPYLEYNFISKKGSINNLYANINARFNFEQNRTDRNEDPTPGSLLFNLVTGFETRLLSRKIQFRLNANNIFNTPYFNHISRYRLLNLPEQGRNVVISVKIPINK